MKIDFENKTIDSYKEIFRQTKRAQESAESVVPDVNDDIGKIASVQTAVYLKSKDISGRGVLITGEAVAAILYITEGEKSTSYLRLTKPFSMEFESADLDADAIPQVKLTILNSEARILNPRKVSVTFELSAELSCYRKESISVETTIVENTAAGMHARYKDCELVYTNAVSEKTFTLSEQFVFPGGKPTAAQLVLPKISFAINDSQIIGSKLIIKGSMELSAAYLSEEVNYPVKVSFSTPFSQILELGEGEADICTAMIELNSVYYDIVNTINGDKALDAEVHALLQIVSRKKRKISYISDVYSNLMPSACTSSISSHISFAAQQSMKLICDERIAVSEDCADVLSVFASIAQVNIQPDKIMAAVSLDIIYRTHGGTLSSVRRLLSLSGDCSKSPERILNIVLSDVYLRPDGASIDSHIVMELSYLHVQCKDYTRVSAVELDENSPYDMTALPAVTLVRAEKEDLWELAKTYCSSVEQICAHNDITDGYEGKLLLIPKAI